MGPGLLRAFRFCLLTAGALKAQTAQKNIIQSNSARYTCSILFCAAWLASPSNAVNELLEYFRRYGMEKEFFRFWNCGRPECDVGFAIDICGFLVALFVLLEVILAYRCERSPNAHKAGTLPTTIVVAPGPVQQYPAQPGQQFVYNPVQQPGQPAYYHAPVMAAPYQHGPITTPYQAPPYQPYPTPTHFVTRDLCGFFPAFFVFLEMILDHHYECPSEANKPGPDIMTEYNNPEPATYQTTVHARP
ncbi:hypothetical protein BGX34_011243 [Mortierella sp. NVP85]|nr:hypothetical protein BGX34_011243 [Mortierella sp. NVP85]